MSGEAALHPGKRRSKPAAVSPCTERLHRGFTLVELLVVIAIIAVLIAILLAAISRASAQSRFIKCKANLRTLVQANLCYAADFRDAKPPLFRRGNITIQTDFVSPDIKWSNTPVGQGILVGKYLKTIDVLMDPSEGMVEDVARDKDGWANLSSSGSSYCYFFRHPNDAPSAIADFCLGATFTRDRIRKRLALLMDINAEDHHNYVGEYSGRAWVNHPLIKRMNVAYSDGSVVDYALSEVQLKFPANSLEELAWVDEANRRRR